MCLLRDGSLYSLIKLLPHSHTEAKLEYSASDGFSSLWKRSRIILPALKNVFVTNKYFLPASSDWNVPGIILCIATVLTPH